MMTTKVKSMNKPITVAYEDLKNEIADSINKSGLPAFVIESIIKDFLIEIRDVAKKQYEYDKKQYEQHPNDVVNNDVGDDDK